MPQAGQLEAALIGRGDAVCEGDTGDELEVKRARGSPASREGCRGSADQSEKGKRSERVSSSSEPS